jgi:integrase
MTTKRKYKANREAWGRIREFRPGRFQASYTAPDGAVYNGPMTYSSRTDARAWLSGIRTDIERNKWKSPKTASAETFRAYATTWVAQRTNTKGVPLRPKTRVEYERQIEKGLSEFADDRLAAITPARVRSWHADRIKAGKTAAAAEARLLRAILTTAVEDGHLDTNPVPPKLTKSSAGKSYRPPTLDELAILHEQVEDRFKLAVMIAAYGGLRLSEWRSLRRQDLQLVGGRYTIDVHRQAQWINGTGWLVGPPKSDRGIRMQTLPTWMTEQVDAHLAEHVGAFPDSLLFAPKGASEFIHDSDFNKTWNPARDAAGVRGQVREHDLRDFGSSHLMAAGGSLIEARDFLGHSDSAVTERHYIHKVIDRAAELADKMPELPNAKAPKVTKLIPKTGTGQ